MTGHRLSQGWSPHMGRPISVRWLSHDRSSYSTNFRPKTDRSDQSDLISGRRLTAAKKCLSEITFRNLNNVMYKIRFCGYHWLLLYKEFPQSKPIMSEIIENLRRSGSELDGVATFQSTNIFLDILSNHSCSGHSCKCLFVWTWSFWHAAYSRTMHVLFHYRLLIKFNVLFTRFDPETGLWKFAPVKTTVAHRTASLRTVASQACPSSRIRGWYGRRPVATAWQWEVGAVFCIKYKRVESTFVSCVRIIILSWRCCTRSHYRITRRRSGWWVFCFNLFMDVDTALFTVTLGLSAPDQSDRYQSF